jgi:hypothetical protein
MSNTTPASDNPAADASGPRALRTSPATPCPTNRPAPARPRRAAAARAAALVLLALAGCQRDDEIRHYTAPRAEAPPPPEDTAGPGRQRLLGAIFDRGEQKWFVKLTGPEAAVGEHEKEFDDFLNSFRFGAVGDRPQWKAPEGWKPGPPTAFSAASFRLGDGEAAPQLTVSQARGSVAANVNRWRGQLGLPDLPEGEVVKAGSEFQVDGTPVLRVDISRTPGKGGRMPPFAGGLPPGHPPAGRPKLTYTTPPGWQDLGPQRRGPVVLDAVLRAGAAEVTASRAGGDLLANVNRWRAQLGLDPVGEEQLKKDARTVEAAGAPAQYFDLTGAGPDPRRILAVVVRRGDENWFFKMTGPADVVAGQKAAFEAFVKSVRLGAGPGAAE